MNILNSVRDHISSFQQKEVFRFCIVYLVICIGVEIGLVVQYVYLQQEMQAKIVQLNKSRQALQAILTHYQVVQQQKNKVDLALKQNKTFNIQKFYQDLAQKYNVTGQSSVSFKRQKLPNGYFEESLLITVSQIDMKTLCELLFDIEQESIVYTVSVDITKATVPKKINMTVSIATLRSEE